jgi:tetratricopeptide (TPR) repeat protein
MTEQQTDKSSKRRAEGKRKGSETPSPAQAGQETPASLVAPSEAASGSQPKSTVPPWEVDLYRDRRSTPLQQAQELILDAWEASGYTRIRLARKALTLSRDCADAYVLLGDEVAKSLEEARSFYEQGVKAGERALGPHALGRPQGASWDDAQARPYLRARYALADCLWALGQSQEAIGHLRDMLLLNPGDAQGVRFVLARYLLELGDNKGLGGLLERYREDRTTYWAYTRALHTYRLEQASFRAEVLLKAALCANYHVPDFLLGRRAMPADLPPTVTLGQEDEAINYASEFASGWASSGDALDWLAEHTVSPHSHRGH